MESSTWTATVTACPLYCTAWKFTLHCCIVVQCTIFTFNYRTVLYCILLQCTMLNYSSVHIMYCQLLPWHVQHCSAVHNEHWALYCNVLYCTVLHCSAVISRALQLPTLGWLFGYAGTAWLYCKVPYYTLHYIKLFLTKIHYTLLHHATLYYTTLSYTKLQNLANWYNVALLVGVSGNYLAVGKEWENFMVL